MCSLLELFTPITGHVPTQGHFFISVCPLSWCSQRDLMVNTLTTTVGRLFCPLSVCCLPYICIIEKHVCKCVKESEHKKMWKLFYFFRLLFKRIRRGQGCCCIMSWEPRIGFRSAVRFILSRKFSPIQASHNNSTFFSRLLFESAFRFTCDLSGVWQEVVTPHYQVLSCKPSSSQFRLMMFSITCVCACISCGRENVWFEVGVGKAFVLYLFIFSNAPLCWTEWRLLDRSLSLVRWSLNPCNTVYVFMLFKQKLQPAHTLHFAYDSFTNINTE